MAEKQWKCFRAGCPYMTELMDAATGIEYLKLHSSEVHGVASKPEKPKKPVLDMAGSCVDSLDWEAFCHKFKVYKNLAGLSGDAASHLLDCLSKEVYAVLFSTYGQGLSNHDEKTLTENIQRLVVRKKNRILSVMELLSLKQDSDERLVSFISRLKAKARQCQLSTPCVCGKSVDYTDQITLYMLVAGISDLEIQEDLLAVDTLTLEDAEKKAISKEAAKYSQSEMAGDKMQRIQSSYKKSKSGKNQVDSKCKYCGKGKHESRESECKAFNETCPKCGKKGHFKSVCLSKKKQDDAKDKPDVAADQDNAIIDGIFNIEEQEICTIISGDLTYNKRTKKWVHSTSKDKQLQKAPIVMKICEDSWSQLGSNRPAPVKVDPVVVEGIADTGCTVLCAGLDFCKKLNLKTSQLLKSNVSLRVADGRKLTVLGAVPLDISVKNYPKNRAKHLLHIVSELKSLFISKACLTDLGIISPSFPLPYTTDTNIADDAELANVDGDPVLAPCGCPLRTSVPDPPALPFEATEENVPKLRQFIIDHYSTSTFNLCSHQKQPEISGPPLHFSLKPDAKPVAVHTPATIPIHWLKEVKEQLDRDVAMGVLELVPPNEPTIWQHRMVVVRKKSGKPRRTVDMQSLNQCSLRNAYPMTSPYQKAMTVPAHTYKTVTDAWEGFHAIPLDEESKKLTQFITPFGVYRYKRGPQGYLATMDA